VDHLRWRRLLWGLRQLLATLLWLLLQLALIVALLAVPVLWLWLPLVLQTCLVLLVALWLL
jgi:hypothetical protein